MNKDWFLEDEDDIFVGSPKSKYFDISKQANDEIVEEEFDKLLEKFAIMEILLSKNKDVDFDINKMINQYAFEQRR